MVGSWIIFPAMNSSFSPTDHSLWQTRPVKRRRNILIIAALMLAVVVAAFLVMGTRRPSPQAALPNPNGYDDFAAATSWLVQGAGDLLSLSPEEIRSEINQNAKALELVRDGLRKQSAVPVQNDMNWYNRHMVHAGQHKSIAQLLMGEGLIHLHEGRTNAAARSFADGILFAHAAHRGGLMIDELMGIAYQAIGAKQLVRVAPDVTPDALEEILSELITLDQAREPAAAILRRDRKWSRGANGVLRSTLMGIAMRKTLQDVETKFETKRTRSVAALRLVMTELAVRGYAARTGKPPTTLAGLVPAWLPAVPLDPFSNRPLVYRATTNSFLLYSVGPDGKDDQGTPLKRGAMETGDLLPTAL